MSMYQNMTYDMREANEVDGLAMFVQCGKDVVWCGGLVD